MEDLRKRPIACRPEDNIDRLLSSVSPEEDKSLQEALDQIAMCVRQFGSPAEFMAAMGLKFPEP